MTRVPPDSELARLLSPLRPAELVLRDWVVPHLDDSMINNIASADYGVNVAEYREAIVDLCRTRHLPSELSWLPGEVLSLNRWSTMDGPPRQYVVRVFCCVVLVHAGHGYPIDALTPLVEAAVELGPEAVEAAGAYLAWVRLHEPGDWRDDPLTRPVLTLALVVLSVLLPAGRDPELLPGLATAFLDDLCAALDEENLLWSQRPVRDLLKRTAQGESRRVWRALAGRCLLGGLAERTGHGALLAGLAQAVQGESLADVTQLRSLIAPGREAP